LNRQPHSTQKFLVREEQVDCQRGVELYEYDIFRVADKRFDAQILLDFPEENFDLPAGFVNFGDGFGYQAEVIGQKFIMVAGFRVTITDPAQAQSLSLVADLDDMV